MDYRELRSLIEATEQNYKNEDGEHFYSSLWHGEIFELPAFTSVYKQGGPDKGSSAKNVLHFPESDIYIELSTYYTSMEGYEWDDVSMRQVFPEQKTITVYN